MPASPYDDDETRERIERIIQQILGSDRVRESSAFSERSYGDEPILRTGADLQREREAQEERRRQRNAAREQAQDLHRSQRGQHQHDHRGSIASTRRQRSQASYQSQARFDNLMEDPLSDEPVSPSAWDWVEAWRKPEPPKKVQLPPTLKQLRALQQEKDERGARLPGNMLFVRQARVAADYEDDFDRPCTPGYRYTPTYRDLSNAELRDYFSWRTQWRRGTVDRMPFTYVRLVAAELVNGVGAEQGEPTLRELQRLQHDSLELDARGMGPNIGSDLRQWVRDYAIYYALDAKLVVGDDERAFADAVATLRLAEREVLARESLRNLTPADAPAKPPTNQQLWQAMGAVSSYPLERSPFFRTHEEEAATVGAGVFRRLAHHCAKRRKVCLVDGLVGWEDSSYYEPFLGLPFVEEDPRPDMTVRLNAAETVSHRFGRWRVKRGYDRVERNRELGKLLRAIDRQMRIDWEFGRPLKDRGLPKYLQNMIVKESTAEHERVEEAERRKITIDLSQLKHIRSAAAKTREALLVDEEREGFVPGQEAGREAPTSTSQPEAQPGPQPKATAEPAAAPGPKPAAPTNPLDLSDLELAVVRRLLAGKDAKDLLGKGAPMMSVLVDSINEKFFDEIGDSVVELDDGDVPRLVEDYVDDVRALANGV